MSVLLPALAALVVLLVTRSLYAVPRAARLLDRRSGRPLGDGAYFWPMVFAAAARDVVIAAPILLVVTDDRSWIPVCAVAWLACLGAMTAALPNHPEPAP